MTSLSFLTGRTVPFENVRTLLNYLGQLLVLLKPHLNTRVDLSSETIGLDFDLSLSWLPYIMYASSKGHGQTARKRRLICAFAARHTAKSTKISRADPFIGDFSTLQRNDMLLESRIIRKSLNP